MRGTDLRVRHGCVESCPSQERMLPSWELIGAQESHWVLLGDGLFVPGTVALLPGTRNIQVSI